MIKSLLKWLGLETPGSRVSLRPQRVVHLAFPLRIAYDRCLEAIVVALGANVYIDDRAGGMIEAGFGLVNNERVRCTFEPMDEGHTSLRIEAFFPAGAVIPERSRAVDALAAHLSQEG